MPACVVAPGVPTPGYFLPPRQVSQNLGVVRRGASESLRATVSRPNAALRQALEARSRARGASLGRCRWTRLVEERGKPGEGGHRGGRRRALRLVVVERQLPANGAAEHERPEWRVRLEGGEVGAQPAAAKLRQVRLGDGDKGCELAARGGQSAAGTSSWMRRTSLPSKGAVTLWAAIYATRMMVWSAMQRASGPQYGATVAPGCIACTPDGCRMS